MILKAGKFFKSEGIMPKKHFCPGQRLERATDSEKFKIIEVTPTKVLLEGEDGVRFYVGTSGFDLYYRLIEEKSQ